MQFAESSECSRESNANSTTPSGKGNSDVGDIHTDISQSTTPNSLLDANITTDTSSQSLIKDASIKSSEGNSKSSYSMDDILGNSSQPLSASAEVGVRYGVSGVMENESGSSPVDEITNYICRLSKDIEMKNQGIIRREVAKLLEKIEKPKENSDKKETAPMETNEIAREDELKPCGPQATIPMNPPAFSASIPSEMFRFPLPPQNFVDLFLKAFSNSPPFSSNTSNNCTQRPLTLLPPNFGTGVESTTSNQMEALSLVVDKDNRNHPFLLDANQGFENSMISQRRKRTKVTDARLPPQKMPTLNGISPPTVVDSSSNPGCLPNDDPEFLKRVRDLVDSTLFQQTNLTDNPNFFNTKTLPPINPFLSLIQPPPQIPLHQPLFSDASRMPTAGLSGLSEPGPIRRNRSIGSRRVTNTATMVNYGGEAKPYRIPIPISETESNCLLPPIAECTLKKTNVLTPVHLRKAKLMFFYTRYPSSNLLRSYFIDVEFQKQNTAQLVKWFSNFREFYYGTIDKAVREAITQGIREPHDFIVTKESELYRTLIQHYNRNQQIEVPDDFQKVVKRTEHEFFMAILTGKDSEQSWKKPIYKIIARMDQPIPEFFRDPSWMSQLSVEA